MGDKAVRKRTPQLSTLTGEILESISDGVFTVDRDWVVHLLQPRGRRDHGHTEG
jgi:uncharacterized protein YrrD